MNWKVIVGPLLGLLLGILGTAARYDFKADICSASSSNQAQAQK